MRFSVNWFNLPDECVSNMLGYGVPAEVGVLCSQTFESEWCLPDEFQPIDIVWAARA